jgi:transmembrane protein
MADNKTAPDAQATEAAEGPWAAGKSALACRVLLSVIFLSTGIAGLSAPMGFAQGLGQMGVPFPALCAIAATALNIVAPFVLIFDVARLGWIAAFALAGFTVLTIPFGHPFWAFSEPRHSEELRIAIEHVSLIGGLVLAGLGSLSRWRERPRRHSVRP